MHGIPPCLEKQGKTGKNDDYQTSNGILAALSIFILQNLEPAANSTEEAIAQLYTSFEIVANVAHKKAIRMEQAGTIPLGTYRALPAVAIDAPRIAAYENVLYTALYKKHMVFIAPNGAIQIVGIPNEAQTNDIINAENEMRLGMARTMLATNVSGRWLVEKSSLNYAWHLQQKGRLTVLMDKPGKDGQHVWESLAETASTETLKNLGLAGT